MRAPPPIFVWLHMSFAFKARTEKEPKVILHPLILSTKPQILQGPCGYPKSLNQGPVSLLNRPRPHAIQLDQSSEAAPGGSAAAAAHASARATWGTRVRFHVQKGGGRRVLARSRSPKTPTSLAASAPGCDCWASLAAFSAAWRLRRQTHPAPAGEPAGRLVETARARR